MSSGCLLLDESSGEYKACTPEALDWNQESVLGFSPKTLAELAKTDAEIEDYTVERLDWLPAPESEAQPRTWKGALVVRVWPKRNSGVYWTGKKCQDRRVEVRADVSLRGVYGKFDHQFEASIRSYDNERIEVIGKLPVKKLESPEEGNDRGEAGRNAWMEDTESGEESDDLSPFPDYEPPEHIEFSATILPGQGIVKGRVAASFCDHFPRGCDDTSPRKEPFRDEPMLLFPTDERGR